MGGPVNTSTACLYQYSIRALCLPHISLVWITLVFLSICPSSPQGGGSVPLIPAPRFKVQRHQSQSVTDLHNYRSTSSQAADVQSPVTVLPTQQFSSSHSLNSLFVTQSSPSSTVTSGPGEINRSPFDQGRLTLGTLELDKQSVRPTQTTRSEGFTWSSKDYRQFFTSSKKSLSENKQFVTRNQNARNGISDNVIDDVISTATGVTNATYSAAGNEAAVAISDNSLIKLDLNLSELKSEDMAVLNENVEHSRQTLASLNQPHLNGKNQINNNSTNFTAVKYGNNITNKDEDKVSNYHLHGSHPVDDFADNDDDDVDNDRDDITDDDDDNGDNLLSDKLRPNHPDVDVEHFAKYFDNGDSVSPVHLQTTQVNDDYDKVEQNVANISENNENKTTSRQTEDKSGDNDISYEPDYTSDRYDLDLDPTENKFQLLDDAVNFGDDSGTGVDNRNDETDSKSDRPNQLFSGQLSQNLIQQDVKQIKPDRSGQDSMMDKDRTYSNDNDGDDDDDDEDDANENAFLHNEISVNPDIVNLSKSLHFNNANEIVSHYNKTHVSDRLSQLTGHNFTNASTYSLSPIVHGYNKNETLNRNSDSKSESNSAHQSKQTSAEQEIERIRTINPSYISDHRIDMRNISARKISPLKRRIKPTKSNRRIRRAASNRNRRRRENGLDFDDTEVDRGSSFDPSRASLVNNTMKRLPQAIIIGVKKGGTRALLEFLRIHPDVQAAGPEVHFFDRNYHKGLEWYRSQMPPTYAGQLTLEKTPSYFISHVAPSRIHSMNPNIRLVLVVRDPVTRSISDYAQALDKRPNMPSFAHMALKMNVSASTSNIPPDTQVSTSWGAIKIGLYWKHLERWLEYFPLNQFHFVHGERLIRDPAAEMSLVQDFLGLNRYITHRDFYFDKDKGFPCLRRANMVDSDSELRFGAGLSINAVAFRTNATDYNNAPLKVPKGGGSGENGDSSLRADMRINRTKGGPKRRRPPGRRKKRDLFSHCLGKTKGRRHPHIDEVVLNRLREFYRPHNEKFYQLCGINFAWP